MNLSILILLQVFEEFHINPANPILALREKVEEFERIWEKYTLEYKGIKIHQKNFFNFMKELNNHIRKLFIILTKIFIN